MTATIGINLRVPLDLHEALQKIAPRGQQTAFILDAVRRELQRRGTLTPPTTNGRTAKKGNR